MERITSKSNQLIKDIKKLSASSAKRAQSRLFVLEGARLCFDVLFSSYRVKAFLLTEAALEKYREQAAQLIAISEESYLISEEVANKLGETKHTQGVFAVCRMAESAPALSDKVIALDAVQDPANMGAVIRTAEALGIESILISRCCDIYNPKTLRASMGGVLRLPVIDCESLPETLGSLKGEYKIYATVPASDAVPITSLDFSAKTVCVIGNEANGVSEEVRALSDALVTIPMRGNAESLNASVAAAITMWEMLR